MNRALHHPLRMYRFEKQLTLEDLAIRLGTDPGRLSLIERRRVRPTMALAEKIAHVTEGRVMPNDFIDPPRPRKKKKVR